jgi:hypothetical protein
MPSSIPTVTPGWWARGLLFENCTCTLVCPGHMHFSQLCTYDRCKGYWALRVDEGRFGDVPLDGLKAVIVYDTPQRMIDGGWTQALIVDTRASDAQRQALEAILTGRAAGPWEKLAAFVAIQFPTEFLPIDIADESGTKRVSIRDRLTGVIEQIRGRDRSQPVVFENIFNQIHAPRQELYRGDTDYDDGRIVVHNVGSHGLASRFEWLVES